MGRKRLYNTELDKEIVYDYSICHMSLSQIGKKYGHHPQVIKRRLEWLGIPIRSKSEAMKNFHTHWNKKRKNT
jgi:hypothetical protein